MEEGRCPERTRGAVVRDRERQGVRAGAMGGKGHGAHLEDQAERARIKADPPLSPLIRIIRSSLSTLGRFTGLSAQPPPHTLPLEADVASFHFQDPQPCPQRAELRGCTLGTLLYETEGPGEGRRGKQAGGGLVSRHQDFAASDSNCGLLHPLPHPFQFYLLWAHTPSHSRD